MPGRRATSFVRPLIRSLSDRPTSVAVWGSDRERLSRLGVGLSDRIDPAFLWFDIRPPGRAPPSWQLQLEADIPDPRFDVVFTPEMRLDDEAGNQASSILVRDASVDRSGVTVADLMRLPAKLREPVVGPEPSRRPGLILLTNVDRASAAFGGESGALRPYIEAVNAAGCTVVVTACSRPRENRQDFDLVFQLASQRVDAEPSWYVRCESIRVGSEFPSVPPGTMYAADALEHGRGTAQPSADRPRPPEAAPPDPFDREE
jgi:hypothetical protein